MKRLLSLALLLFLGLTASFLLAGMAEPDAKKLWRHITDESPYSGWIIWGDRQQMAKDGMQPVSHHKIYVNEKGRESITPPTQFGAIIVRENYNDDDTLKNVMVMMKVKGFNGNAGDWFWSKYSPEGKVQQAGKIQECIGCHRVSATTDYLFVHEFDQ